MNPILFLVMIKFVAVEITAIYLFKCIEGISDAAVNFFGYSFDLTTSFVLNRNWTFRRSGAWIPAAVAAVSITNQPRGAGGCWALKHW
jgi:putative flippase GtrA